LDDATVKQSEGIVAQ